MTVPVDAVTYDSVCEQARRWVSGGESRYISIATVNNVMEAYDVPEFQTVMNGADLVTPDGMPLVWGLRLLGIKNASRVYGPDLTIALLGAAQEHGVPVGFYGASPAVLNSMLAAVCLRFPRLRIAYQMAPPFRPLTAAEDEKVVSDINESGAGIVFVGLSTPKQEFWMAAHRDRVRAVMLGVGAAFDFIAGSKPQAPRWMMRCGLEWLFRLATEPRRLWKRYLKHNPRFIVLFAAQLWAERRAA